MSKVAGALDSIDERAIRINNKESQTWKQTSGNLRRARPERSHFEQHKAGPKALEFDGHQNGGRCGIGGSWTRCHTSNLTGWAEIVKKLVDF
jgi:hypothetical protein